MGAEIGVGVALGLAVGGGFDILWGCDGSWYMQAGIMGNGIPRGCAALVFAEGREPALGIGE